MLRRHFLAGSAAIALSACATPGPAPSVFNRAHVDEVLSGLVTRGEIVGISALVTQHDRELYFGAFGYADREAHRPMARDTIVQIWSMTKPIVGVSLLTLVEEGKVSLDAQIGTYLPELADLKIYVGNDVSGAPILRAPDRAPTVRDFTRHTGGLTNRSGQNVYVDEVYAREDPMNRANSLAEMMRRLGRAPLLYQPGTRWLYGDSVDVQAALVERVSGIPFQDYIRRKIMSPLRMRDTGYYVPPEKRARLAAMYDRAADGAFTRQPDERAFATITDPHVEPRGGYGLVSTLDDYMRLERMLLHEGALSGARVLKPESVRLMRTNHLPSDLTDRHFLPGKGQVGFGIDVAIRIAPPASAEENPGMVGEFFWDGAASTLFWCDPANDLAALMFVQMMPFDPIHLHRTFRRAVYDALGQSPSPAPAGEG